jgi:DNA-binding NarL/FixJ family response regulator
MLIKIAIVEDDKETRKQVSKYLSAIPGFEVVGEFESAEDIIANFRGLNIDVCLMDIGLPDMNGIDCIRQLKVLKPSVNFIIFSSSDDNDKLFRALAAGATSYMMKHQINKLKQVIEDAAEGTGTFSPGVINKMREFFIAEREGNALIQQLTDREKEVLKVSSTGKRNKEIAAELNIDETTVKKHFSNIIAKLHVGNRVEAINLYLGR